MLNGKGAVKTVKDSQMQRLRGGGGGGARGASRPLCKHTLRYWLVGSLKEGRCLTGL